MDQFLKFVSDVFECDMSEITLNTVYGEFEKWDSMMMLRLTMELEEEYQVSIPIEAIGRIRILEDLYGYVKENRMQQLTCLNDCIKEGRRRKGRI